MELITGVESSFLWKIARKMGVHRRDYIRGK